MSVSDRAAGSVLEGRYRLEARLSHWGVGEVWRAADGQRARAIVTVKLLAAPTTRRTERLTALKLLGDRLAKLGHPGLLPVVEVNTAGEQPFVVYESWEAVGLGEWLTAARATGEPTGLRAAFGVADRVLAVLGAGHRQRAPGSLVHGAVHHDAVRVRVVEGRDPEVRMLDVGLGAEQNASALAALVDAAPSEYGAPEHAREPALRNAATDVFAAAVLILRLLAPEAVRPRGHRSWGHFVAQRESEVHGAITALRADVHPSVWEALAQALARRPEARPADAERLRELLRAASWGALGALDAASTLAPVVPMSLPTLHSLAPAPLQGPVASAGPLGPPPVPRGMQLGVAAVLGAHRPADASLRPRRATAAPDEGNFGPAAPRPVEAPVSGAVSLDDAQATRQDISLPDGDPSATADAGPPTEALPTSGAHRQGLVDLDLAERTAVSPFGAVEQTQLTTLPVPLAGLAPSRGGEATWTPGPIGPPPRAGAPSPALLDATMPLSPDAVPAEVAAALAAYAPVNPASWDSTSNLQPVSLPTAPPAAPGWSARPRAADPFALVAAAGRGDARAWDGQTQPPERAPPRSPSTLLLVGLAVLAAALAFLVGMRVSASAASAASAQSAP